VLVVVRLKLPPSRAGKAALELRLAWDAPRNGGRRVLRAALAGLPAVPRERWLSLPEDPEVREHVALLMVARAQKEAARAAERGDRDGTREWLVTARGHAAAVPCSLAMQAEMTATDELVLALDAGKHQAFVKGSKYRSHSRQYTHSPRPPKPPGS
jgi:Ca-activated chloride channel homolog